MEIEKTIQSLSNKIWYRFIKVLYILCFLFISSIALFFSYDVYKPKNIFDNEKSYIQCTATEGILYSLALNGVYLQSDYISSDNDKMFSQWCLNAIQEKSKINPADIVWDDEKPENKATGPWEKYTGEQSKPPTRQRENGLPEGFEIETQPSPGLPDYVKAAIKEQQGRKSSEPQTKQGGDIFDQIHAEQQGRKPSKPQFIPVDHDPFAPPYKLVSHYKTEGTWNSFVIAGIISIMTIFLMFETGRRIFYYVILGSLFPQKQALNED